MHKYAVIIEDPSGSIRTIRYSYQIECESEDEALMPYLRLYPHGFGQKVLVGVGVWRRIEENITVTATVVKIDSLPIKSIKVN